MKPLTAIVGCIGTAIALFCTLSAAATTKHTPTRTRTHSNQPYIPTNQERRAALNPAMASTKHARPKSRSRTSRSSLAQISTADILDAMYKRGFVDENGHFFTRQEISDQQKVLTTQQIAQRILPAVVRLTVVDAHGNAVVQGSGFVIGKNMIATNIHVIAGAHAVTANFQSGRSETVKGLVSEDVPRDIALVYADTTGVHPLMLAGGTFQIGDPVVAVGSPQGLGNSLSTGVISGVRSYLVSKVIQTTAAISPGSSGGALLNMRGQVLGITSFFYKDGQNLNFAYSSNYIRQIRPYRAASIMTWQQIEQKNNPAPVLDPVSSVRSTPVASTATFTNKPLAGLKGVLVVIESINNDAKKDGLDPDQIKVEIELRLRKAGIRVFDKSTDSGNDSLAILDIAVDNLKEDDGLYVYSLSLSLIELVHLIRSENCSASATTWSTTHFGTVGTDNMATYLRQIMDNQTDRFANDYLAQNPK